MDLTILSYTGHRILQKLDIDVVKDAVVVTLEELLPWKFPQYPLVF